MRVHPLHLRPLRAGRCTVIGPEAHHLVRVLRVAPGARLRAFDGDGLEAEATVVALDGSRLVVEVGTPHPGASEAATDLTLVVSLLKGDKLAAVVRMGTELGAARFRFVASRYADVGDLGAAKLERLERIAREAAKQSGRSRIPELLPPLPLSHLATEPVAPDALALVAHPDAPAPLAAAVRPPLPPRVITLTGPEGGFADDEIAGLTASGWTPVALGPRVLRAETAPLALAATLLLGAGA